MHVFILFLLSIHRSVYQKIPEHILKENLYINVEVRFKAPRSPHRIVWGNNNCEDKIIRAFDDILSVFWNGAVSNVGKKELISTKEGENP